MSRMKPFKPFKLRPLFFKSGGGGSSEIKETEADRAAAQVAAEQWNYYQTDFGVPQEEQLKASVKEMDTAGAYDYVDGVVNTAYENAGADNRAAVVENERSMGMNGNSSRMKLADATGGIDMASQEGIARSGAAIDQKDRYLGGTESVVNIGLGKAASAQTGLSDIANAAEEQARSSAISDFKSDQGTNQAIGTIAGMGTRAALEDE